jgi:hypothetical protein
VCLCACACVCVRVCIRVPVCVPAGRRQVACREVEIASSSLHEEACFVLDMRGERTLSGAPNPQQNEG